MYENSKQVNKQWLGKDGVIQQTVCGLVVGYCPFWEIFTHTGNVIMLVKDWKFST